MGAVEFNRALPSAARGIALMMMTHPELGISAPYTSGPVDTLAHLPVELDASGKAALGQADRHPMLIAATAA